MRERARLIGRAASSHSLSERRSSSTTAIIRSARDESSVRLSSPSRCAGQSVWSIERPDGELVESNERVNVGITPSDEYENRTWEKIEEGGG